MRLEEYKENLATPLRKSTLCFLVTENQVLLAMKKRGFGEGKLNGIGGKVNDNETIEDAAKREIYEEIGVEVEDLEQVGTLEFYFPDNPSWSQQVTVFVAKAWKGQPTESDEMAPQWFDKSNIPLQKMWPDDHYWLPQVLEGRKFTAGFVFGLKDEIIDYAVQLL